ncbi:AmmeMemoRadiSam system protein B [Limisalsivibrio acetivorans]|uniref:AmmeMemoRadiSam system protein B n=1 Tax=Limisalsivibrio acetivorans TaxID=1304888 RepID=UPI0003B4FB9B|nr:AmmeMemoRadiSam system protein B [Limisalsivibrio acetivorans]
MLRKAAVKGLFYPSTVSEISEFIESAREGSGTMGARAVLVPHAGYVYSGRTAVKTLSRVRIPDTVILIGPNHTSMGSPFSVYSEGAWEVPGGEVRVDDSAAGRLISSGVFTHDTAAHRNEHSLEVIVPILKQLNPDVAILPVTVGRGDLRTVRELGRIMAEAFKDEDILVVISSDFNHFENASITEEKDRMAIDAVLKMDTEELFKSVTDNSISMCGVIPAGIGIEYLKQLGGSNPQLVEHTHSGEVSGDNDKVVGYAGIIFP